MACHDQDVLWKEFYREPSPISDYRSSQGRPSSPDFSQKQTRQSVWVDAGYNPPRTRRPVLVDAGHNPPAATQELRRCSSKYDAFCVQRAPHAHSVHTEFQDHTALFNAIKNCGNRKDLRKGSALHAEILERGLLETEVALGNALLSMYGKCGVLEKAQDLFNKLPARNVVTWNALIAAYAQNGLPNESLICFKRMSKEGPLPNAATFIGVLKACGSIGMAEKGEEIHADINKQGLLEKDGMLIGTALVDMYAKCGALEKAQGVFDKLQAPDIVAWNALISGYTQHGLSKEAFQCFAQMQDEGLSPDAVTFICILKACGSIGAIEKGEEIHAEVVRRRMLKEDIQLGNATVDMYAKCGTLAKARGVFDGLVTRNVVTWTSLISGYMQHGLGVEALRCFEEMQEEGLTPNGVTFTCILKACGSVGALEKGEEIHAEIERQRLLEKDIVLGTALMDMYAKCGAFSEALRVFDKLPTQNVVTWNALIAGYTQHELGDEALGCFKRMQEGGFSPDAATFICILKACGTIGAVEKGTEIHEEVNRQGLLGKDIMLGNALVDMYAKCGELAKARGVFDKLHARNVSTWTALISGYAQVGTLQFVFDLFIKMREEGIQPNVVTFITLLTACSHAGLVEQGQMYFNSLSPVYHIIPNLELKICMLDIFSRAGQFDKAISVIEQVPPPEYPLLWSALMGICQKWAHIELGRWTFEQVVNEDEKFPAAYVYMRNMYAAAGLQ